MKTSGDPGLRLPIKLDTTSNGEFAPVPLDAAARQRARWRTRPSTTARAALGLSRRALPRSRCSARRPRCGAFNRAFAAAGRRGGRYALPDEAAFELAAARGRARRRRVHLRRAAAPREPAGRLAPARRAQRVPQHAQQRLRPGRPRRVLLQRRAAEGRVPRQRHRDGRALARAGRRATPTRSTSRPPAPPATAANALDGSERLLLHGRCMPTLAGEIDGMDAQAARFRPAAFKTYTQFGPPDGPAGFFLDDERHGTPFIERARKLGVRNIAVHKGLRVRPARLRVLDRARHRPGGAAPSRHDLPDLPRRLRHRA